MIGITTALAAGRWLMGTRMGRVVTTVSGVALALFLARRSGRKAAEEEQERATLENYADTRKRADQALREAENDLTDPDERLEKHGRLRDD